MLKNEAEAKSESDIIITSVDPGSTNCGFAKYSVTQDRFLLFDLADLRTSRAGDVVDALHTYATSTNPCSFSDTTLVVVERQMGTNTRNMCIEASLRTQWRGRCICVPPQKIMTHFGISSGTPRLIKKKKMIKLTRNLLTPRENTMVEKVVEARRSANRSAKKDFKRRLAKAKSKKRKRLPKLKLPYPSIKYDDILEAAAQAIWAAEDVLGHKVKRRRQQQQQQHHQKQIQDFWTTPTPSPPPASRNSSTTTAAATADVIVID